MKKNTMLLILGMVVLVLSGLTVSAVCCERLPNDGLWCQETDSVNECDQNYGYRSDLETCDAYVRCRGTCVDENRGKCSEGTPELECIEDEGTWYQEPEEDVPACQKGCCVAGEYAYFINAVECKHFATTHNVNTDFRPDLITREECSALITATTTGACVLSTATESACMQRTNVECSEENAEFLTNEFGIEFVIGELEIKFYENLLCTAPGISDCAKSEVTECKDKKVYYKDTCGNFANIYDSARYEEPEYWTRILKPNDPGVCTVDSEGSLTCGNCNPYENTICRYESDADIGNAVYGDYVCGDLGCEYEGTFYEHGDSWCAGTIGALARYIITEDGVEDIGEEVGIFADSFTGELTNETVYLLQDRGDYNTIEGGPGINFNTPGTRYFKMYCSFGEILFEECRDYRNAFCMDFIEENGEKLNRATCTPNLWKRCSVMDSRDQCEDAFELCKWVPGYRWDFEIVEEHERSNRQGSCVPLIAPGFDFWEENTRARILCEMGNIRQDTIYETYWMDDRDSFHEWSKKTIASRCLDGCFSIPQFAEEFNFESPYDKVYPLEIECSEERGGSGNENENCYGVSSDCSLYDYLTEFYDESECRFDSDNRIKDNHLSSRRGHYCHKDGDENQWVSGKDEERQYDCTPVFGSEDKDERKERDYPIYLTHNEWLFGVTERTRAMGDCGYKPNTLKQYNSPDSETITAVFQKLTQEGGVDENVTAEQIIYLALENVEDQELIMETDIQIETGGCFEHEGMCFYGTPEVCIAGGGMAIAEEGLCPYQSVCCVFEDLGGENPEE